MNKKDRYSQVVPLVILICLLLPYLRHTTQTMVIKKVKNPYLFYNASTMRKQTNIIMNQVIPVAREAKLPLEKSKFNYTLTSTTQEPVIPWL